MASPLFDDYHALPLLTQRIVMYKDAESHHSVAYATAYTEPEVRATVLACKQRHRYCRPWVRIASEVDPDDLDPGGAPSWP